MRPTHSFAVHLIALVTAGLALGAQQRGDAPQPRDTRRQSTVHAAEAAALAAGWSALAQGNPAQAAKKAAEIFATQPRSVSALMLLVEAELARGNASAALGAYERWLGQRALEEPGALRQIARAALREGAAQTQDMRARAEARRALAAAGEPVAEGDAATAAVPTGGAATRAQAELGDRAASKVLVDQLKAGVSDVRTIDAVGNSGNKAAIPLLAERLKDPRTEIRGSAVEALAKLGGPDVVPQIAPLLSDRSGSVRLRAAAALQRLGDDSGASVLQQFMNDPMPAIRLAAVEATASNPNPTWLATVRELAASPEVETQARAARLLAAHDPDAARKTLETLAAHENPAIRDLASTALGDVMPSDLSSLRVLLTNSSPITKVRASARVLEVTR